MTSTGGVIAGSGRLTSNGRQQLGDVLVVHVFVEEHVVGRGSSEHSFLQAGVGELVDDDVVRLAHQRGDQPVASSPACRVQRDVLHSQQVTQSGLQLQRQLGVAEHGRRARAVYTERVDGLDCRRPHALVRRQVEVVLGGEVDAGEGVAALVASRALRADRRVQALGVHPQTGRGHALLPLQEGLQALYDVGAFQLAVLLEVARQAGALFDGCQGRSLLAVRVGGTWRDIGHGGHGGHDRQYRCGHGQLRCDVGHDGTQQQGGRMLSAADEDGFRKDGGGQCATAAAVSLTVHD